MTELYVGSDQQPRCHWCHSTEQYVRYHDQEWGFPVADDSRLFEKICLESFQSGLSWRTILKKRDNFREAFEHFQIDRMAAMTEADVERLLQNAGIIRHRGKIEAVIHNARCAQALITEKGSLAAYFWQFEPQPHNAAYVVRATSPESVELSKDLKKRGWKFVGPTTIYSFMQAMGMVNDHALGCFLRDKIDAARAQFQRPCPPI